MAEMQASEQKSFDDILKELPNQVTYVQYKLQRLRRIVNIPSDGSILDIGAAQGVFVAACQKLGYKGYGIEPWPEARENAARLASYLSMPINIVDGSAEEIPYQNEEFDIVHANSVMEHVVDLDKSLDEIFRVLKKDGVFWFSSASSMCPYQGEISGFPFFGWYPNPIKLKIMNWAKYNRPDLIGHTKYPAIHWFTPWKARRILTNHGFRIIYDRWDLRGEDEGGSIYKCFLGIIRKNIFTKAIADILLPSCSYAAIK
jgi:ubiquinone/menaquinone biosynthesis C-methylase UbiE